MEKESKVVKKKRIAENGNGNEIDSVVGNGKGLGNSAPRARMAIKIWTGMKKEIGGNGGDDDIDGA